MLFCSGTCCSFDYKISSQFWGIYRLRIQPPLPAVTGVWLSLLLFEGWEGGGGKGEGLPPKFISMFCFVAEAVIDWSCLGWQASWRVWGQPNKTEFSYPGPEGMLEQVLGESMRHRASVFAFLLADSLLSVTFRDFGGSICVHGTIFSSHREIYST